MHAWSLELKLVDDSTHMMDRLRCLRVLAREEYGEGRAHERDGHRAGDEVRVALRRDVTHRRDRDKPAGRTRRPLPHHRRRKRRRSAPWWQQLRRPGGRATSSCWRVDDGGSHCSFAVGWLVLTGAREMDGFKEWRCVMAG